ncbi:cinnamoyl-CoA reductase CAD2-like [Mercurialis annua]|uniref:cinnamoyl-CoA reductase CAD2-like n=1 Tax=Mercurialis annua TaxID=3986 RepID=UPI0021604959|nr:cinnamoyl-CoA reductase CAD2-like [Mercurialis annua]
MSGEGKVVCVTGGSGYIASWLVKLLLHRAYTVKATVSNLNDLEKTQHLVSLDGAKERLQLLEANLVEEGSFDSAVDECEGVFHVASPVFSTNDPQKLVEPAIKGTLNVLKSCSKVSSIKRVVVTSSMGAVMFNGKPVTPDTLVDESWYSDTAFCQENKLWYMLSKTLAEDVTWKFAKENGMDLVTVHPGLTIGPLLQPKLNLSVEIILNHINGQTFPNGNFRFVDVRDVANAHILAFERLEASGRYCLVGHVAHFSEFLNILRRQYPKLSIPEKCVDDDLFVPKYKVSKEKVKTLGLEFTPLELTTKDFIESLKMKGFINISD